MKILKTWFEVLDFFGGSPPVDWFYEQAVKKAEKSGVTFDRYVWSELCQMLGEENIDCSYADYTE